MSTARRKPRTAKLTNVLIRFRPEHLQQIDERISQLTYHASREDVLRSLILRGFGIADPLDERKLSAADSGLLAPTGS